MSNPVRHALVTGGSRGIGLAIAQHLAANNFRITLLARDIPRLQTALSTLPTSHLTGHEKHHYVHCTDIGSEDFWDGRSDESFAAQMPGSASTNIIPRRVCLISPSQTQLIPWPRTSYCWQLLREARMQLHDIKV